MDIVKLNKITVSPEVSLISAMKILDSESTKVLFVINSEHKLIGSITDGDIRRAILHGIHLKDPISEIMSRHPKHVKHSDPQHFQKAKTYIQKEMLPAVPILDDGGHMIDIVFWHDFLNPEISSTPYQTLPNPVVIMAGGKGSRLDPITKILPKPLIPIGESSMIEKIMNTFYQHGFHKFILTLNYKKEMVRLYISENQFPYQIDYLEEKDYLGTAGSLGLLTEKIQNTFFVSNCDVILNTNLQNILTWHHHEKALLTLVGYHKEMVIPYGTLDMKGGQLKTITEKPKLDLIINTGIYVLEPSILSLIPKHEPMDMNQLIEKTMMEGKVSVYPLCEGWFDLGQWTEYQESLHRLGHGYP